MSKADLIVDRRTVAICRLLNDNKTSSGPELRQASRESTLYSEYVIPGASRGLDSGITYMMGLIDSLGGATVQLYGPMVRRRSDRCDYWIF